MRAIEVESAAKKLALNGSKDKELLLNLLDIVTYETWTGAASIRYIAEVYDMSQSSVQRGFDSLVEQGLITRERRQSRFGELTSTFTVNASLIVQMAQERMTRIKGERLSKQTARLKMSNDFAPSQSDYTPSQPDYTLVQPDYTPSQVDSSTSQSDCSTSQADYPVSVLSVSSVERSVERPVERPVVLEQPPSETPRAETAEAPRWRTIPRQQRFAHQALYFSILEGLGYDDFKLRMSLRNVLQDNLIFPDQVDIQAFLTHYEH